MSIGTVNSSFVGNPLGAQAAKSSRSTGGGQQKKVAGYDVASLSNLSPEQMQLFSLLFGGSMGGIQSGLQNLSKLAGGDEEYFKQLEAPAHRQFGQLQGQIASRFSGQGLGGRKGSGFYNTQNTAAQQFAEQLQSNRMGMQQQAIQSLLGLGNNLLGRQTQENFLTKSPWLSILEALSTGVGQAAGSFAFA